MDIIESIVKNVVSSYVKEHSETAAEVVDLFNHLNAAVKCAQSLPGAAQAELRQLLVSALAAKGIYVNFNM